MVMGPVHLATAGDGLVDHKGYEALCRDMAAAPLANPRPFGGMWHADPLWEMDVVGGPRRVNGAPPYSSLLVKGRRWGDNNGWGRTPGEILGVKVHHAMDVDISPPGIYRIGGVHDIHGAQVAPEAAVMHRIRNARGVTLDEILSKPDGVLFLADDRITKVILGDPDANVGGYLRGDHPLTGRRGLFRIDLSASLIDPSALAPHDEMPFMDRRDRIGFGRIDTVRRSTLDGVMNLDPHTLGDILAGTPDVPGYSPHQIDRAKGHLAGVKNYFDHMKRGGRLSVRAPAAFPAGDILLERMRRDNPEGVAAVESFAASWTPGWVSSAFAYGASVEDRMAATYSGLVGRVTTMNNAPWRIASGYAQWLAQEANNMLDGRAHCLPLGQVY